MAWSHYTLVEYHISPHYGVHGRGASRDPASSFLLSMLKTLQGRVFFSKLSLKKPAETRSSFGTRNRAFQTFHFWSFPKLESWKVHLLGSTYNTPYVMMLHPARPTAARSQAAPMSGTRYGLALYPSLRHPKVWNHGYHSPTAHVLCCGLMVGGRAVQPRECHAVHSFFVYSSEEVQDHTSHSPCCAVGWSQVEPMSDT